jgi:hypothetical protein
MFNLFNSMNTQDDELNAVFATLTADEPSPIVTVVQTTTTKVSIRTADATIEAEQTDTTVTTAPVEVFLEGAAEEEDEDAGEFEGVYSLDVKLLYSPGLIAAITEYSMSNYTMAEPIDRNGPIVTVRFTSPLRSSLVKLADAAGIDEDEIAWTFI